MKRRMKKGKNIPIKDAPKSMNMMGAEPFKKKAKKPEPDDKPTQHQRVGHPSINKNQKNAHSSRVKRLTGVRL